MLNQTISLFCYFSLGMINRRLFVLIFILSLGGLLLYGFISELAIINSQQIASALLADFLRYTFVLLALLMVVTNVAEDFDSRQFGRLLTMPVSRWQYIAAQVLLVACVALILSVSTLIVLLFFTSFEVSVYWSVALGMEVFLVGLLALLAALSLEKIPQAVFFALAIYLLAKLSGLISQMLTHAVEYSDGSATNRFVEIIFNMILHLIPRPDAFAQNDLVIIAKDFADALTPQLQAVSIYALFLIVVSLIDFYRKEFNQ